MGSKQQVSPQHTDFIAFGQTLSIFFSLEVLGFELMAYTLSHSLSPFFWMGFFSR
jgi:hypothetical protein